jgi:hypothetical protein
LPPKVPKENCHMNLTKRIGFSLKLNKNWNWVVAIGK